MPSRTGPPINGACGTGRDRAELQSPAGSLPMLRSRFALVGLLLLLQSSQPARGLAQPAGTSSPAENCENCLDDDGDGAVDRADDDCPAPADGARAGLADVAAAKTLDRCHDTLQRAGAKL